MPNVRYRGGARAAIFAIAVSTIMVGSSLLLFPLASGAPVAVTPRPFYVPSKVPTIQSGAALQKSPYLTQPGTAAQQSPTEKVLGLAAPNAPVTFTVGFSLRNSKLLEQILQGQATVGSPSYHQWLTLQQEQQMFGADPVEVQNTINYFTSLGLKVQTQGPLSVSFTGSALQADLAFRTQISTGTNGGSAPMMLNTAPLSLPAPIASGVTSVNGFEGESLFHPTNMVNSFAATDLQNSLASGNELQAPLYSTHYTNFSTALNYTNHAFLWYEWYSKFYKHYDLWQTITPPVLNYLYNAEPLLNAGYNGVGNGKPINIAIVMAGGINPDDLRSFSQMVWNNPNQILSRLSPTPVDGAFTDNGTVWWTDGASGEMALDIEFSSTMAPRAHITPVYGPCLCTNVLDDVYATIAGMGAATFPSIVSNSWGGDEDQAASLYGPNWQNDLTMHNYFMLLDARGATVMASSADGGGFDKSTGELAASFPAADPYVVSVDGIQTAVKDLSGQKYPTNPNLGVVNETTIFNTHFNIPMYISTAASIAQQSYWYDAYTNTTIQSLPPDGSGGFGTSAWFNQSWWQHAPGVADLGRSLGSTVSGESDYNQSIYFDGTFQFLYGGTSFACPTTAGEFALIDDYLAAHGQGAYLGNGNPAVWRVANAWENGNLSLVPFYDIVNGTSYWGNHGVNMHWQFPAGQKFPYDSKGQTTYGNTLPGFDFPTGWGNLNVYNFAADLLALDQLPGQFQTLNSLGTAWNPAAWGNMALNSTYTIHVNATASAISLKPHVTIKFLPETGPTPPAYQPALSPSVSPSVGYTFTVDTSTGIYTNPGLVIFEFGNSSSSPTLGFAYSWIAADQPKSGSLVVSVVSPTTPSMVGGFAEFNTAVVLAPPLVVIPSGIPGFLGPQYPNSFTVKVTLNGNPVYDALVTAAIKDPTKLAFGGSRAELISNSYGNPHWASTNTVSWSYTNLTGEALVYTWNVIQPTTWYVNATYGGATGNTSYNIIPGPDIGTTDWYGGNYSEFNSIAYLLLLTRQRINGATVNAEQPNMLNNSNYYDLLFLWQGEILNVTTNDWQGNPLGGIHVWLGNIDRGGENRFHHYAESDGLMGVTNTSGTANTTGFNGRATIRIPDNQSDSGFINYPSGATAGYAFVASDVPGEQNRTFSYTEPCFPTRSSTILVTQKISCQFNNSYQRNYTAVPAIVLANPVDAWTETPQHVHRDFFTSGSNITWGVNVSLPMQNPFLNGIGTAWIPGAEHITTIRAYVDGNFAGTSFDGTPPYYQFYNINANLTGSYAPGIHTLRVVVTDSVGHVFTNDHIFIVGSIAITDLPAGQSYTQLPYNLTWQLNIPSGQINNHTFNQTLEIRYISGGCGGPGNPCAVVVNLSVKIHDGVVGYLQNLNTTLLSLDHFYSGLPEPPPGQYQITIWLNANHTGSIITAVTTYFVFDPLVGFINGPTPNEVVPLGNITISYAYEGQYVTNATLSVFPDGPSNVPAVFTTQAFVPGVGLGIRGSAATWTAVTAGSYMVVLALGTPDSAANTTVFFNVSAGLGQVYLNQTHGNSPLQIMNPATTATVLALIAAIVGLLVGLWVAPALRPKSVNGNGGPPKAWSEAGMAGRTEATKPTCPACHEEFESTFALAQHRKVVHGIEE
ncbi:MAG TPA: protease pro-enzyme activation domain-containing protein [Thermoplasmata archaeon]|nr:protease pro-enzyme activation domain-containing protein [Thermoplasmata archaeon]